jgi:hypothetical protein
MNLAIITKEQLTNALLGAQYPGVSGDPSGLEKSG